MNRLSFGPLLCLLRLQTLGLASLHHPIMRLRMRLFVILVARAAEKEQNRLSEGMAHAASFRNWQVVVKRTTMTP